MAWWLVVKEGRIFILMEYYVHMHEQNAFIYIQKRRKKKTKQYQTQTRRKICHNKKDLYLQSSSSDSDIYKAEDIKRYNSKRRFSLILLLTDYFLFVW